MVPIREGNTMDIPFRLAVCAIDLPATDDRAVVIDNCVAAIAEAGERGADLLVLPEEPDIIVGSPPGEYALEEHPVFRRFKKQAAKSKVGITSTLSVAYKGGYANTGFLLDRSGNLSGVYRKKHPAPSEEAIITDATDGDPFPVFDFEGVKLGIAICMDIHAPEMFRIYGLKGADLVCVSTMYLDYTGDMLESLEKARAIDSQMYFALSRYITRPFLAGKSMGYAKVIAPDGRVISSTAHKPGVAIAEFDPKWRMEFWGDGYDSDMRVLFDAIRHPEFYRELVKPKTTTSPFDSVVFVQVGTRSSGALPAGGIFERSSACWAAIGHDSNATITAMPESQRVRGVIASPPVRACLRPLSLSCSRLTSRRRRPCRSAPR